MHNIPHTEEAKAKMSAARRGKPNPLRRRISVVIDGVESWECSTCRLWFDRAGYYTSKRQTAGITSQCRACHTRTNIESRNPENARQRNREYMARARRANPETFRERERLAARFRPRTQKSEARAQLNAAVRAGRIARPPICEECGRTRKVHGHHSDYSKPLAVQWLCSLCHGRHHRKRRSSKSRQYA